MNRKLSERTPVSRVVRVSASRIGEGGLFGFAHDHHVDYLESEKAGMYDFYYEFDLYYFSDDARTLVAKSYSDEPTSASLICFEMDAESEPISLQKSSFDLPLVRAAVSCLRSLGKHTLKWLDPDSDEHSYKPIPEIRVHVVRDA